MDLIASLMSLMSLDAMASLLTLTILEIVLGIDNLVFLSILANKLPEHQRALCRKIGLIFAMASRLVLLGLVNWITQTHIVLFSLFNTEITITTLVLFFGGLFLLFKAVGEIHEDIEGGGAKYAVAQGPLVAHVTKKKSATIYSMAFWMVVLQVMIIDIVFSIDSVITAVGMTHNYFIMSVAIVISVIMMLFASDPLSKFIERHPTVKMLALSFLILIGTMLMAQSIGYHVEKGYLYFAIAFSLLVESLNIQAKKKRVKKSKAK